MEAERVDDELMCADKETKKGTSSTYSLDYIYKVPNYDAWVAEAVQLKDRVKEKCLPAVEENQGAKEAGGNELRPPNEIDFSHGGARSTLGIREKCA
jgi:hypothetical protein